MRKTIYLFAVGVSVTVVSALATFAVIANRETAAETEIYLCFLIGAVIFLSR